MGAKVSKCIRNGSPVMTKQPKEGVLEQRTKDYTDVAPERDHSDDPVLQVHDQQFTESLDTSRNEKKKLDVVNSRLSLSEAAQQRPMGVDEAWSIVKRTSDNSGMIIKPTVNRKGWKTVRIFVSSTFRDFFQEREILVKEIFPELRLWCEERKLRLVECDLRWGVPENTSSEDTIKICLEELDKCRDENVEPYFLNLVGDRTGWIPVTGDMNETLAARYGWVYGLSVTEMEIVHGAFRRLNPNAIFMIRNIMNPNNIQHKEKGDFIDTESKMVEKLSLLKKNITERFPDDTHNYSVSVVEDNEKVTFQGLSEEGNIFHKTIINFLKNRIDQQYPLDVTPANPLEAQRAAHEMFMDSRSEYLYGRDNLINEVEEYCTADFSRTPLLIVGKAGAGKSSVIAKCAKEAQSNAGNDLYDVPDGHDKWKVFYHFVGATPGSADLTFFLQRLTKTLKPKSKETVGDLDQLAHQASHLLSDELASPMMIFVDAINQFDEEKQHLLGKWLPQELSSNIKVVLSTIEATSSHVTLRSYKPCPREIVCGPLDDKSKKKIIFNFLKVFNKKLSVDQMRLLVQKNGSSNPLWLTLACEELRVHGTFENVTEKIQQLPDDLITLEMELFTRFENECGGSLIKSTLCLLEVSRHGLLETELLALLADRKSAECPTFSEDWDKLARSQHKSEVGDDQGMISDEKEQLKNRFAAQAEETYALNMDEIDGPQKSKTIVSKSKQVNLLPARDWAVISRNLKPLLRPCGDLGEGRLDFFHRSLSKAVRLKYFSGTASETKQIYSYWRSILADYFVPIDDVERKAEELPYQLQLLLDENRLTACLVQWPIFNRLYNEYFSLDLLQSWQKAGGYALAAEMYKESLAVLQQSDIPSEEFGDQAIKVANFLIQAGQHQDAYDILKNCIYVDMKDNSKLADIYASMAYCKNQMFEVSYEPGEDIDEEQFEEIVELCNKSNNHRKKLKGDEHDYKMAKNNIILVSALCFLDEDHEALKKINEAIEVFQRLNETGMMVWGMTRRWQLFSEFDEMEAELMKARELCLKTHGEHHRLYGEICFQLAQLYENGNFEPQYEKAYDFYLENNRIGMIIHGPDHPETLQTLRQLQKDVYETIRRQRERLTPGTA